MERKFASKLSQLKPAAEARKQAKELLKETIESVIKFKHTRYIISSIFLFIRTNLNQSNQLIMMILLKKIKKNLILSL